MNQPAFPLRTLRDQIAEQLRNEILAHQHAPDAPLREDVVRDAVAGALPPEDGGCGALHVAVPGARHAVAIPYHAR